MKLQYKLFAIFLSMIIVSLISSSLFLYHGVQNEIKNGMVDEEKLLLTLQQSVILSTIVLLSISVLVIFLVTRKIVSPLLLLTSAMKNLGTGKSQKSLKLKTSQEIELMSNSFNQMRESLIQTKILNKTYQKELEDEINKSKEVEYALNESAIVAITNKDGIITYVNNAFERISKYSKEELIGQNHRILKSGYHPDAFYNGLWKTISSGRIWKGTIKNKAKNGSFYWVDTTIVPLLDKTGTPEKFIAIRYNVTRQKNVEKRLSHAVREIAKSDILKDEFASMVTHELKTPLTPIRGYCEMLIAGMEGELNDSQRDAISKIDMNAARLQSLIGDVLDSQKLEMGRMQFNKIDLETNLFLTKVKNDSDHLMKEKEINFNVIESTNTIHTDEERIRQVLDNLIRNAVDFVPKHGNITVGTKVENDQIIFYVKDDGIGIPDESKSDIFKKFYQVDTSHTRKHGGTGLGLVVSKGIVEGLGGKIWFTSQQGKGTTFYFSIPGRVIHAK